MSERQDDRGFERWALAGACVLALAGIAAFLARRDAPQDVAPDEPPGDDLVVVRIGGERPPPREAPPRDEDDARDEQVSIDAPVRAPADDGAVTPPEPPPLRTVVVQPGETLGQIAQRELGAVSRLPELVELNGIANPDAVRAGTKLKLPPR